MITLSANFCNPISQKIYDDSISAVPYYQLTCTCGCSGCLVGHGSYPRSIKAGNARIVLRISRVKCRICRRTHAILIANIVPYSQIALKDQLDIISDNTTSKGFSSVMEHNPVIDENNVGSIVRQYRHHWEQRLLSGGIPLSPVSLLIEQCFSFFGRQFMQIKSTPNILFLRPT